MALNYQKLPELGKKQELKIHPSKNFIEASLSFYFFEDHGHKITYVPALNISGYGETTEESHQMALEIMDEVFNNLASLSNHAMVNELKKYGWSKVKYSAKKFTGLYVDQEGVLKNFNLSSDTVIAEELHTVGG